MIRCYIYNCHTCKRAKASRDRYNDLLKLLPIPARLWTDVTLDFITRLPINNSYNTILMVVDCLIKKSHYIACTIDKTALLEKLLLSCSFRIFENFMAFYHHLFQIEVLSLFQKSGKISTRSLLFLPTYLYHVIQRQINKVRLLIKRWKNIYASL